MTKEEKREYIENMKKGKIFLDSAEKLYLEKFYGGAMQKYYVASICFETAKQIAKDCVELSLQINAKDKEYYCLEKIDELERFKNVRLGELTK